MMKSKFAKVALTALVVSGFVSFLIYAQIETTDTGFGQTIQTIRNINPEEAFSLIKKNGQKPNFVILDVRTPREFNGGHIPGAVNLNYYAPTFGKDLDRFDKEKAYLVYCLSGMRSGNTLSLMKEAGFHEVYNMLGGIAAWKALGLPSVR